MSGQPAQKKRRIDETQELKQDKSHTPKKGSVEVCWVSDEVALWEQRLDNYHECIVEYANKLKKEESRRRLTSLDKWYYNDLPTAVHKRASAHKELYVTCSELVDITEWKMLRGKWRPKNKELVASNSQETITSVCKQALAVLQPQPHKQSSVSNIKKAISIISELKGVGPATASALLSVFDESVPFMSDEATLTVVPNQPLKYTLTQYPKKIQLRETRLCGYHRSTCKLQHHVDLQLLSADTFGGHHVKLVVKTDVSPKFPTWVVFDTLTYVDYVTKMQEKVNQLNSAKKGGSWSCKKVEKALFCDVKDCL